MPSFVIRAAETSDRDAVWSILEPVIRGGETYTLPRDMNRDESLGYWFSPGHRVFVLTQDDIVLGTCYLRANQRGGGDHVANCGYMTAQQAAGRGVARAMCAYTLDEARRMGFRAMQFNFVVRTNERAVRLWESFGFRTICRLPGAFHHPVQGYVDAFVMFLEL